MPKGRICIRTNPKLGKDDKKDLRSRLNDTVETFNEEIAAQEESQEDDN